MTDLVPIPFPVLVTRMLTELETKKAVFHLPRWKFYEGFDGLDLGVSLHGKRAATPFGPAAGPHTQLAQNIVLAWAAGARIIELKTVQILDELEIARPCIDMETIGYNIEWSQELTLSQSLEEYVKAAMLIEILKAQGIAAKVPETVFDMSAGYDLAGIQSEKVRAFLEGMKDASALVGKFRAEIPARYAALVDRDYPTKLSDSITLSTFHGCPPDEIERIAAHLMEDVGLNVVVKLNPTLLGKTDLNATLRDRLGYTELHVPDETFEKDAKWEQVTGIVERLGALAEKCGKSFGVKFTNTLLVENHRNFFPAGTKEMYLSGPPLHVLAMELVGRFRAHFGDRFPVSFSAGIDAENFADAVALGLKPVSACTDLLKGTGYGKIPDYLANLATRMEEAGAADIDSFIAKTAGGASDAVQHNTKAYLAALNETERYSRAATNEPPERDDATLSLLDCSFCRKCINTCPNDAIFRYDVDTGPIKRENLMPGRFAFHLEAAGEIPVAHRQQIGIIADICNECGNCEVTCPEAGAPHAAKAQFFLGQAAWDGKPERDGFWIEAIEGGQRIHHRQAGDTVTLDRLSDGRLIYNGNDFALDMPSFDERHNATGATHGPVDLGRMRLIMTIADAITNDKAVNYVTATLA